MGGDGGEIGKLISEDWVTCNQKAETEQQEVNKKSYLLSIYSQAPYMCYFL